MAGSRRRGGWALLIIRWGVHSTSALNTAVQVTLPEAASSTSSQRVATPPVRLLLVYTKCYLYLRACSTAFTWD